MAHTQRIPPTTEELDEYVAEILKFAELDFSQRAEVDPDPQRRKMWRHFSRSSTSNILRKGVTFEKVLRLVREHFPGPKLFIHENHVLFTLERLEGTGKARRATGIVFDQQVPIWRWNSGDIPAEAQDIQAATKTPAAEPEGDGGKLNAPAAVDAGADRNADALSDSTSTASTKARPVASEGQPMPADPGNSKSVTTTDSEPRATARGDRQRRWLAEAMLLARDHPDWSDAEIARAVHVAGSTLTRSRVYQSAAAYARGDKSTLLSGHIEVDPNTGLTDVEAHAEGEDLDGTDPDDE